MRLGLRSRDPGSRVFWTSAPDRLRAPNIASSAFPSQMRNGMLRLQRVGCARDIALYRVRNGPGRSHSTHTHVRIPGYGRDHGRSHSRARHEHHAEHTTSRASTGPAQTPPQLDPTVLESAAETCQSLVLKRDYESFLTSKFYPNNAQGGLFALKAFYVYTIPLFLLLQS